VHPNRPAYGAPMSRPGPFPRRRERACAAAVITGLWLGLAACAGGSAVPSPTASTRPTPSTGTSFNAALPSQVTGIPFIDESGKTVTLASLRGVTVVLADFLTLCQEVCPLTSANLRLVDQGLQRAGLSAKVRILEITVDPQRDTPDRLAAYQKLFGAQPNWSFLTGTPAQVANLWKALGVSYDRTAEPADDPAAIDWLTGKPLTYDVDHQDIVFVVDAAGHERWLVDGTPSVPRSSAVPTTLQRFLNDDGRANESAPPDPAWTSADVLHAVGYVLGQPLG
jgi:protein SCO1